jgi:hypothetical protein
VALKIFPAVVGQFVFAVPLPACVRFLMNRRLAAFLHGVLSCSTKLRTALLMCSIVSGVEGRIHWLLIVR